MERICTLKKEEFREQIRKNLNNELRRRHMTQTQLLIKCGNLGFHLTQPELSKLLSGKSPVTLYQITAFSKAFDISVDQLITGEKNTERLLNIHGTAFVMDPRDQAYNGYLGTYFTLLHSTSPFEKKLLNGKLTFLPSDESNTFCKAIFKLDTSEKNKRGSLLIKEYQGELLISRRLGVAYCVLVNDLIGEVSMIEFRHREFLVRQVQCRMGLVLTTSSGESKIPTVQKIFLSRDRLTEEDYSKIQPYLKLTDEELFIARKDLEGLNSSHAEIEFAPLKEEGKAIEYFLLDENAFRGKSISVNRQERARLIREVRELASGPWVYGISEREDSLVYEAEKEMISNKNKDSNKHGEAL